LEKSDIVIILTENLLLYSTIVYSRDIEGMGYNITLKPAASFLHNNMAELVG